MATRMDRRGFLRLVAQAGLAFTAAELAAIASGCGRAKEVRTVASPTPGPAQTAVSLPSAGQARVGAVLGKDLDTITREAIDAIGGIQRIVDPGDKVYIRPNSVGWGHR